MAGGKTIDVGGGSRRRQAGSMPREDSDAKAFGRLALGHSQALGLKGK